MLLVLLVATTAQEVSEAAAQTQRDDLSELWERYPLEAPEEGSRSVGAREKDISTAEPPPTPAERGGPFALTLLVLAIVLAVVGVAGGLYQAVAGLRRNRSESLAPDSGEASRAKNHQA